MADKIISFAHRVGGVLTDVTSAKLRDSVSVPVYGLRLAVSPFTVIVAAGTDLTHDGTGLYSYTATGLSAGSSYQYALEWVYLGETKRQVRTFVVPAISATGFWWTQAALQARWGVINTAVASALDGQGTVDAATIQAVGDGVDADADRLVRAYGYGRPVPADSDDYAVASRLAVDVLHYRLEGRRGPDLTPTARDKLAAAEAAAWAEFEDLLQGPTAYNGAAIDFPRTGAVPVTAPIGLRPTTDLDGRTVLSPALSRGPVWDAAAGYWRYW